ncbi:hypothetical protein SK128_002967, partial [Halocaridina rubra]
EYLSVPFTDTCPPKEFQKEQLEHLTEISSPAQTFLSGSTYTPTAISPAMMKYQFYPERRPGKGPKKIRYVMDRVYSISSLKIIGELKKLKEDKDKNKQSRNEKQLAREVLTQRKKKRVETDSSDKEVVHEDISDNKEPPEVSDAVAGPSGVSRANVSSDEELMSLHDSSDESLHCEIVLGLALPWRNPK